MSVTLFLICHAPSASALKQATEGILHQLPLALKTLDVSPESDPEQLLTQAQTLLQQLPEDEEILILTDLYGSTPSNIARRLLQTLPYGYLLSGVSLNTLVRCMNYAALPLPELIQKLTEGACDGIRLEQQGNGNNEETY